MEEVKERDKQEVDLAQGLAMESKFLKLQVSPLLTPQTPEFATKLENHFFFLSLWRVTSSLQRSSRDSIPKHYFHIYFLGNISNRNDSVYAAQLLKTFLPIWQIVDLSDSQPYPTALNTVTLFDFSWSLTPPKYFSLPLSSARSSEKSKRISLQKVYFKCWLILFSKEIGTQLVRSCSKNARMF